MDATRPHRSGTCGLELRCHRSHKFRATVRVDRRGQRVQHGQLGVGEGQRHAGVSMQGNLTQRYARFDLDRN